MVEFESPLLHTYPFSNRRQSYSLYYNENKPIIVDVDSYVLQVCLFARKMVHCLSSSSSVTRKHVANECQTVYLCEGIFKAANIIDLITVEYSFVLAFFSISFCRTRRRNFFFFLCYSRADDATIYKYIRIVTVETTTGQQTDR